MSWLLGRGGRGRRVFSFRGAGLSVGSLRRRRGRAVPSLEDLEERTLPTLLGTQLFPSDYPWNQNISSAPVATNSAAIISHIGSSIGIHPDWGEDSAGNGNSPLYGIPYNVVHGNSVAKVNVIIDNYPGESDVVPVPIPANAVIEGDYQDGPNPNGAGYGPGQRGDSHLLIWDEDTDTAYELFGVSRPADKTLFPDTSGVELPHTDGMWHAAQETVWHMTTDDFRTLGDTSADAAGLSILAGLARPEEGLPTSQGGQGAIDHALRFTLPSGDVSDQYLYPASHMVSDSAGSDKLPFGARLRLMNTPAIDAQIAAMGPEAQIIAQAMQQYGLVLADIGSPMFVTGSSASEDADGNIDQTWDMDDVLGLEALTAGDFQVVNLTPVVTGLSETSAPAGTTITITGQNFSGSAGHLSVFFGSQASAAVTYVDDSHITALVPAGAGTVNVTVQSGVNETDTVSDSPGANVNAPIFGYGTSVTTPGDLFTFSPTLPATHLSITATSPAAAGGAFDVTVTALDMNDDAAAGFGGTVHFTSTDPLAVLPSNYTFQPGDPGSHTFQITAETAGNQTFTVSDTPDGLGSDAASVTVDPGQASLSRSTVTATSATIRAGQTSTLTLTARDAFGNQETAGGLVVTFSLNGTAGGTFGTVTDHGNGTYSVVFSATSAGTGTLVADIGGRPLTSTTPTLTVTADSAPVIQPIGPVTLPHTQFPDPVTVQASSPAGNPLTYSVTTAGDSLLFDLQQQYQFQGIGYVTAGATAYVLHSNQAGSGVMGYYLLRPSDGALFAYDGSGSYSHTFADGTPIATLGVNVYTDPMLLLNAMPPADYTTLYNLEQQYQFTGIGYVMAGATAYVLHSNQSGPGVGGYYLIRSDGALFAYDGSGSYSHAFAQGTPLANLGANLYTYPGELTNAQASPTLYAQLYQVEQQYDLQEMGGSFYTGTLGNQAEWLYSPDLNQYGQHWYTLTLSGGQSVLHAWEGYQDSSVGAVVATFNTPSVYNSPVLLTTATFPPDPAVTATINQSGMLTIGLPSGNYLGTFKVTVSVTDGLLSTSQTVAVTSTDTAPTLSVTQNNSTVTPGSTLIVAHESFPLGDAYTATGSNNQTVTTAASVSAYSQLFSLQQRYRFQGTGYVNMGGTAYVLTAAGDNSFGNALYLISPSGGLYAYDGSGNYATSFADTPLAQLGANVYADPMLLMNAQPAVNYAQLNTLEQQYHFQGVGFFNVSGAPAYVLTASTNSSFGNPYYLLSPAGGLYAYDGSGSYAHTFANVTPVATLDPGVYVNPTLLLGATANPSLYAELVQAEAQFDLQTPSGGYATGMGGDAAKLLYSPVANVNGQHYYSLVLSANGSQALLYARDAGGSAIPTGAQPVATFDPSVYFNPMLLTNAKAPVAATGVTATAANGSLTISAPFSFAGTFQVTVTSTDGSLTTSETFQIASTDTAPVPNTIPNQTASRSGSPLSVTLGATDAQNYPVTYTATAVGYSPAYNLQQQYNFTGLGYFSAGGAMAYVLQSNVMGGSGGFYLLSSTGGVYAYDGSGSYAHTFANSANLVAQLSPSIYMTPTLLTSAAAPATPAAQVSVSGNSLSVNVSGVSVGTVFEVIITAGDGAETRKTGFLVTVTA